MAAASVSDERSSDTDVSAATRTAQPAAATSRDCPSADREILAFERQWWKYAGAKEQAIKELFDMSSTRYYQVLNALIDNPGALDARPDAHQAAAPAARQPPAGPLGPPPRPGALSRQPPSQ